jgi:hypothetical protein
MNRRTLEQGYLGLLGIVVLVAVLGFIWPNYSSASRTSAKISSLESKIGRLEDARDSLEEQTAAVRDLQTIRKTKCRHVPENAQVAELVRAISLDVDGVRVVDQTFTVSGRRDNVDGGGRYEGLSMIVDLEAEFDQICSVIDRCARHSDLIRITGLDISKGGKQKEMDRLKASISIDAIYLANEGDRK